jgi:hypothetical protein
MVQCHSILKVSFFIFFESDLSIQIGVYRKDNKNSSINGCQEEWAERLKEYLLKNHPAGSDKRSKEKSC